MGLSCAGCEAWLCRLRLCKVAPLRGQVPPCCTPCLRRSLGRTSLELAGIVTGYIPRRDCYRRALEILAQQVPPAAPAVPQPVSVPESAEQVLPGVYILRHLSFKMNGMPAIWAVATCCCPCPGVCAKCHPVRYCCSPLRMPTPPRIFPPIAP